MHTSWLSFGPHPGPAATDQEDGDQRRQRLMQTSSVLGVGQYENRGDQRGRSQHGVAIMGRMYTRDDEKRKQPTAFGPKSS